MRYAIIDTKACDVKTVDAPELPYEAAGLKSGQVDFGTLYRDRTGAGISITVYEFGLLNPPSEGRYFSIGNRLFEGNAVLFEFDAEGETVDITRLPPVCFYKSFGEAEAAIQRGEILRPQTAINGEVVWAWNRPSP